MTPPKKKAPFGTFPVKLTVLVMTIGGVLIPLQTVKYKGEHLNEPKSESCPLSV